MLWDGETVLSYSPSDSSSVLFSWLSLNSVSHRTTIYPAPHLPNHLLIFLIDLLFARRGKWWSIPVMAVSNPQLSHYLLGSCPPTCRSYFHCSSELVRILYNPHPIAQACKTLYEQIYCLLLGAQGVEVGLQYTWPEWERLLGLFQSKKQATWFFYLTLEMSTACSMLPPSCILVPCFQGLGKEGKKHTAA